MSRVLVTGGNGFLGSSVVAGLAATTGVDLVVSGDVRQPTRTVAGVVYAHVDITQPEQLTTTMRDHRIDSVVHLAAIMNPGPHITREQEYRVDVDGTRHVLEACLVTGVRRIVVSSSGAAYGYHRDNPAWITETDAIRGNPEFAYSDHKRIVEGLLARAREQHPELEQVVFRIGTILGATVDNQITALFERRRVLAIAGSDSPFVFIWDEDVVACMVRAATDGPAGIFNLAGGGAVTVRELAGVLGKTLMVLPAWLLTAALSVAKPLRLTRYGPEQVGFLRYRPVLSNERLRTVFGYTPGRTSLEALEAWKAARAGR
ncbi:UDP-glucose 4-epimerase [Cryobacterium mesophilum]|uniref:SDR family oxidoreductase n=1 Tax=Terrimesophilobacter mesophilus TaxID=433647 RepID=A0A4R8VBD7_9MICO|nr:SDR family oxidoreductase [Terrimesophilobacter mesophilus]MBB5633588.1 UDP-glucose 4-epimerase [Terrimesophilobacter mesophilus]TFB80289.1 SDR family oxidoreductase [Terrimesophilobacter mesophilus]